MCNARDEGLELHERLVASGLAIPTVLITAYPDERIRLRALRLELSAIWSSIREEDFLDCIVRPQPH